MKSAFIISLDFEMLWGVSDSTNLKSYYTNVLGEWEVIPKILDVFRNMDINATWATVGMLMCRDYKEWKDTLPAKLPTYFNNSNYLNDSLVKENPKLFFGRPLVELIMQSPGQEIGGHTYSHFYCAEPDVTIDQFDNDLACAYNVANSINIKLESFVFPRNQIVPKFLDVLVNHGYNFFRGNPNHWLYANGDNVLAGNLGRVIRLADNYLPLSGNKTAVANKRDGLYNCPASVFLRPWSKQLDLLEQIRINKIKNAMTDVATSGGLFHLWWHPHNFGVNQEKNLSILRDILYHYGDLNQKFGMESICMKDFGSFYENSIVGD